jgi:hypothetical protein
MKTIWILVALAACNNTSGPPGGDDDDMPPDAHVDTPAMIKLTGMAVEQGQSGSTPLASMAIGVYKMNDEANALATTMSDASGNWSITLTTDGNPLDVYFKGTKADYVDAYSYPAKPIAKDTNIEINTMSNSTFSLLLIFTGASSSNGMITMVVLDDAEGPVKDATVSSMPASGAYRYMDANGRPQSSTATNTDGLSFFFDVPPGNVTVSASKSGMTFKSHALNARAGKFTTTSIKP